jgi:hypothetical protein
MCKVNELPYSGFRNQAERTAGELEAVNVDAHGLEEVLEMAFAVGGVVGSADFSDADFSEFGAPGVGADEAEAILRVLEEGFWLWGLVDYLTGVKGSRSKDWVK